MSTYGECGLMVMVVTHSECGLLMMHDDKYLFITDHSGGEINPTIIMIQNVYL